MGTGGLEMGGSAWTPHGKLVEDTMWIWRFMVGSLGLGVGIGGCFLGRRSCVCMFGGEILMIRRFGRSGSRVRYVRIIVKLHEAIDTCWEMLDTLSAESACIVLPTR